MYRHWGKFWAGATAFVLVVVATVALSDYVIQDGNGVKQTIFSFTCFVTKICPAHVNTDSAGNEMGIASNPFRTNPVTGATPQPVTQSGPWAITGGTFTLGAGATVQANAGTNLSTQFLALEAGGNLASVAAWGLAQGSTTATQKGLLGQCAVTSSAPTYVTAKTDPFSCDTAGNMRVSVTSATGLAQGSSTPGQSGSMIMAESISALPTYTTAQTNPLTMDLNSNLRTTPNASSTGGATPYHSYSAGGGPTGVNVKASAGTVYVLSLQSVTAGPTVYYFKFYDLAVAPTCGTGAVAWATAVSSLASGYNTTVPFPTGLAFNNGIGFCITGAQADADASAANTGINISIAYK